MSLLSGQNCYGPAGFTSEETIILEQAVCCRKENVQKTSKWSEQKLPQKSTLVQPAIPVLDIPVDDDMQNQPSPEQPNSVPKVVICAFESPQ